MLYEYTPVELEKAEVVGVVAYVECLEPLEEAMVREKVVAIMVVVTEEVVRVVSAEEEGEGGIKVGGGWDWATTVEEG